MKTYLKAKEELGMETQIFHNVKIIIFKKNPPKETKIPSRYYITLYN
jgi:hypothetical protein